MVPEVETALGVDVTGVVQGVGFRPFVHRLAHEHGLVGLVGNDTTHVFIEVRGTPQAIESFLADLRDKAPRLARIDRIDTYAIAPDQIDPHGFRIVTSTEGRGARSAIPPDTAVCPDCVAEMFDPTGRRHRHPFITCTNCGPRLSIISDVPYDRPNTTMAGFEMCARCASEYDDPADRRHHAQPIACHDCGPTLRFGVSLDDHVPADPIGSAAAALARGQIVAIKGIGGFHLVCDATNVDALATLRRRKHRPDKPFAVMVADLEHARELVSLTDLERDALGSPAAPIVLASSRHPHRLPDLVAPGSPLLGVMVPYTPIHHLLFETQHNPLVVTSANAAGSPLAYTEAQLRDLAGMYDAVLWHDRPIRVPVDDSVVRQVAGVVTPIRRARGYAPIPVRLAGNSRQVLAVGGELKNTFCVAAGERAWISPHIGDMENLETLQAFEQMAAEFSRMYDVEPDIVAADAHPRYLSSRWARRQGRPLIEVQHHHAHVAAVMAEHDLDPARPVLGFAFDGTGYGLDGTMWGGEVLLASASTCDRVAHLHPIELPGGDDAIRNPHRVALAQLRSAGVEWQPDLAPVAQLAAGEAALLERQLERSIGCVPTTSMGRLFDAVASLLDVRHQVSYEAQAAIELEVLAGSATDAEATRLGLAFATETDHPVGASTPLTIDQRPLIHGIVAAIRRGDPRGAIARALHLAVADAVTRIVSAMTDRYDFDTVVLSGGVFQNALLTEQCIERLHRAVDVRTHQLVPANDGGLSLGQAFVAAHSRAPST